MFGLVASSEMQETPKIVIERLKAETLAQDHPDADILTAFSEKSLSETERDSILEHVARCSDCREILALALPEPNHEEQIVKGSAVGGWFTWPALRWGFATAGLLIVGIGALQYQRHERSPSIAFSKNPPPTIARQLKNEAQPSEAPGEMEKQDEKAAATPGAATPFSTTVAGKAASAPTLPLNALAKNLPRAGNSIGGPLAAGALAHGPRMNQANQINQTSQQEVVALQAPVSPPYAPLPTEIHDGRTAASAAVGPATLESKTVHGRELTQLQPLQSQRLDQQPQEGGSAESRTDGARRVDEIVITSGAKIVKPAPDATLTASRDLGAPSWTISSTGGLQRSFDQGHSWQDVNVSNPALEANSVSSAFAMDLKKEASAPGQGEKDEDQRAHDRNKDQRDQEQKKQKDDLNKAKVVAPILFRAVSANGMDVWAGGSGGMLYHSIDSGSHWVRVVPFGAGAFLTGDIVSVTFTDPQHGQVMTSAPETWVTGDAGKNWQKR
jgi:hypothetical protein